MRKTPVSVFGLTTALIFTLAACVGDEGAVGGNDVGDEMQEPATDITSVDTLVLGLVASEKEEGVVESAEDLAEQLSEELGGFPVEVDVSETYVGALGEMGDGNVHLLMSPSLRMIEAEQEVGATPLLQSVRNGEANHVAQWLTNDPHTYCQERPVADEAGFLFCNGIYDEGAGEKAEYGPVGEGALENLEAGATVSFVDEGLTSSYKFPKTQLDALGIEVDAEFAGAQSQSVLDVYEGRSAVGVSGEDARRHVLEEKPDVGQEVVVFAWAGPVPNHGIVASGRLSEYEQKLVVEAFLAFAGAEDLGEGDPLYEVYGIQGLVEADDEALDAAREVYDNFIDEP